LGVWFTKPASTTTLAFVASKKNSKGKALKEENCGRKKNKAEPARSASQKRARGKKNTVRGF